MSDANRKGFAGAMIHGRFAGGFGWIAYPGEFMQRSSTALASDGRVWLIDPVAMTGIDAEIEALGTVAGVIMTVGWHDRDVKWFADRYGVPLYVPGNLTGAPSGAPVVRVAGGLPECPLQLVPCGGRGALRPFQECAVWWPEHGVLVTGDSLGTATYFAEAGALGVHPIRRASPPTEFAGLPVRRLFPGHGMSLSGDGLAEEVARLVHTARWEFVPGWVQAVRAAATHR
jgi:hypothetical protein